MINFETWNLPGETNSCHVEEPKRSRPRAVRVSVEGGRQQRSLGWWSSSGRVHAHGGKSGAGVLWPTFKISEPANPPLLLELTPSSVGWGCVRPKSRSSQPASALTTLWYGQLLEVFLLALGLVQPCYCSAAVLRVQTCVCTQYTQVRCGTLKGGGPGSDDGSTPETTRLGLRRVELP